MTYPETILSRRMRRMIMVFLIAVFFLMAPLLIAYTAGYRYDIASRRFEQTGVISIDVEPADSRVFLNTVEIKKKMPLRLANRAPGGYHILIEREGYQPWQRDITVESKQTTYIKNITLFPYALPTPVFDQTVAAQSVTPSRDGAYAIVSALHDGVQEVTLFHAATKQQTPLLRKTPDVEIFSSWSPSYDLFFLAVREQGTMAVWLFDPNNPTSGATYAFKKPIIFSERTQWFQWQKNFIIPSVILRDGASLISLSPASQQTLTTLPDNTEAWMVDEEETVWIFDQKLSAFATLMPGTAAAPVVSIPQKNIREIIDINEHRILASDDQGIILVSRNMDAERRIQEFPNARARLHPATKEWFLWSPWELWTVYENGDKALLNRTSQTIIDIAPLDKYGVLLLATPNGLHAFNPGYYVTHDLFTGGIIETSFVREKNRVVYFLGTVGNRRDLYELRY